MQESRTRKPRRRQAKSPPTTAGMDSSSGRRGVCFLLMVFALVPLFLGTWLGALPVWRSMAASNWVAVPADLLSAQVATNRSSDGGDTYRVTVHYAYQWPAEGLPAQRYESTRYDFIGEVYSSGRSSKQATVEQLQADANLQCYVNPERPEEAVLTRRVGVFSWAMLLVCYTITLLIAGAGLVVLRKKPQEEHCPLTGMALQVTGLPETRCDDGSGRRELQPSSRLTKFVGMLVMGLILCGVAMAVFLFAALPEYRQGKGFSWFFAIFIGAFGLAGLGVLAGAIHAGLALFNPRWSLVVNRRWLAPGTPFEIEWECIGSPHRVSAWSLTLEATESATYRRGTRSYTDTHVCQRLVICETTDHPDMRSGSMRWDVPADMIPTIIGSDNSLTWKLIVHAAISGWPDVNDSYEIVIAPESCLP